MPMSPAQRAEYASLYATATLRPEHVPELRWILGRLMHPAARARYDAVSGATGVPAFVVGILHMLEASGNFGTHLHNGDPLTARTVHVPAGRPAAPPAGGHSYSWEESAIDALRLKSLHTNTDWSIPGLAYVFESYNGFGYRNTPVKSPYLWSFSTAYTAGKFVADHKFDPRAVSRQAGAMVLVRVLVEAQAIPAPANDPVSPGHLSSLPFGTDGGPGAPPAAAVPPVAQAPAAPRPYPGRYLRIGMEDDAAVMAVQARLKALGIDPQGIDGDFGANTEQAVRLYQARATDASGAPLDVDGIVGPDTWEALFGRGSVTTPPNLGEPPTRLTDALLAVAADEVGVREVPDGSNRGPRVDLYLGSVSQGLLGQPWCCAFVYWCFREASAGLGIANPFPKTGGVLNAWERSRKTRSAADIVTVAEARKDPSLVRPGAVFFLDHGGGTGHTGIVVANINGSLVTIEGNTFDDGNREGNGVFRRSARRISQINLGFIHYG